MQVCHMVPREAALPLPARLPRNGRAAGQEAAPGPEPSPDPPVPHPSVRPLIAVHVWNWMARCVRCMCSMQGGVLQFVHSFTFESVLGPSRPIRLVNSCESKHECCASCEGIILSNAQLVFEPGVLSWLKQGRAVQLGWLRSARLAQCKVWHQLHHMTRCTSKADKLCRAWCSAVRLPLQSPWSRSAQD